ncbi:MAG: prepilin-type N-terminal cleavage/methylation domain-containing protein [Candidatus Omnitrophota bacterium]
MRSRSVLRRRGSGFTLVEVLIVLVIVAVLAAIMLPKLIGNFSKADVGEAREVLGTLRRAYLRFLDENGGRMANGSPFYEYMEGKDSCHTAFIPDIREFLMVEIPHARSSEGGTPWCYELVYDSTSGGIFLARRHDNYNAYIGLTEKGKWLGTGDYEPGVGKYDVSAE